MAGPDPYAGIATEVQPQADPYAGIASPIQSQQLPPVVYAQPVQYNGHPEDYVWDERLPDPGKGMAWPQGTVPDPHANRYGNAVGHLPGEPKANFGRPLYVDPQTQDAVNQLLHTAPAGTKPPNAGEDAVMSAGAGAVRGTGYLLTSPGDLTTAVEHGIGWLGDRAMEALGPEYGGWSHYHSMLNEHGGGPKPWDGQDTLWPTTQDFQKGLAKVLGPNQELYEPKTEGGRIASAITELAPSTLVGGEGALWRRLAPAVAGGSFGQGAEEITRGTQIEPWAKLGGTLVGAGGAGALTQPATVEKMLAQGARGATQDQLALAQALMQRGEQMGVPITSAEAVNQVTSGAFPGLTRLQRVAEGTREGQAIYGPRMAQRPQQLADALHSTVLDPLSPPTASPSAIGLDAQQGSQAVLDTARQAVNAQAKPFYDAIGGEVVQPSAGGYARGAQYSGQPGQFIPDEQFGPLAGHPAYQEALAQVRGDPLLNAGVEGLPDNDLQVVDRVVKQLDRNSQGYAQTAANPGGNNFKAAQASNARSQADELAAALSSDWRTARDIVRGGHEVLLDPLDVGPVGQMARTNDVGAQTAALYPRAPLEGSANETVQALRALGRVNDGEFSAIPGDLTRQHLANSWNEASRGAVPNQWVGANWYKQALGNPEQKAVTLAGVGEAGGPELADALSNFGDVAQATGWRARQGSSTAFNQEDLADMAHGGPLGTGVKAIADPFKVPEMLKDAFTRWQVGRNSEALARSFLDGSPEDRGKLLSEALKNHPSTLPGWGAKLFLYDNPVLPGRGEKKEAAGAP